MKILKFKGKMPLKNKILIAIAILLIIATISLIVVYTLNEEAREWININILRKEITEDDVATIQLDVDKTEYIYAYDKYITILSNGTMSIYNSYGAKSYELDINISSPVFATSGTYLAVAESGGQNVYIINERKNTMGK